MAAYDLNIMTFDRKNNNFDAVRLVLSVSVFLVHSYDLSVRTELKLFTLLFNSDIAVQAFFIISGFLVTMSFHNSRSLNEYFVKRMRRIYPAYFFVVVFTAVAGYYLSAFGPKDYFSINFVRYLFANLTFFNFLQPSLPGVFTENAISAVNGALWTIRFEVLFYIVTPVIGFLFRRFRYFLFAAIYLITFACPMLSQALIPDVNPQLSLLVRHFPIVFTCYITGALLFYYHDIFTEYAHYLFLIAVAGYIIARIYGITAIVPVTLGIIVVHLASGVRHLGNAGKYGDFSYGMYLWHFPILQVVISAGLYGSNPYGAVAISFVIILFFASLSWYLVEKPFLLRQSHYRLAETFHGIGAKE